MHRFGESSIFTSVVLFNLSYNFMKKVLFLAAAGLVLFASCRKSRTCTCTYTDGSGSYVETYLLSKKSEAEAYCNAEETPGYTTCELD